MSLAPGTRLGPYEVLGPLGAGGMGEVYRARDTRLGRDIAIKLLPAEVAQDGERLARFRREAHLLASLNHPHVATVHGLEELDGKLLLVLELVEGEDLAERLQRGAIPMDEALGIAKQIAEALEEAHEKGIVHRDLKPANVRLTPEGKAKVLDFGLAKAYAGDPIANSSDASQSPTLTRAGSDSGMILGTAAYMSPEQARGMPVDRRADIWAFGVVLFEMLTGRRLFKSGGSASETLAAVLREEPNWQALPAGLPPRIHSLVRRCLTKDRKQRLQAIGEARIAIDRTLEGAPEEAVKTPRPVSSLHRILAAVLAALGLALAVLFWMQRRQPLHPAPTVRLSAELGVDASLVLDRGSAAILSPDGTLLAFVGRKRANPRPQLYVRRLDQLQASPLSDGASSPFFSPDGQWIAFFTDGNLKKIAVTGGAAVTLCDAPEQRGGSWGEDGWIVFAPSGRSPLWRVASAGGTPTPITTLDATDSEITHRWPQVLPGGKAVLYTAHDRAGFNPSIVVQRLPSGPRRVLRRGGYYGRYLPSGHVTYIQQGTLVAAPFDLDRLELAGEPVPALPGVSSDSGFGTAQFAFSGTGTMAYVAGAIGNEVLIHWMDRDGRTRPLRNIPADYGNIRFSPDGRRLAMDVSFGQQGDVWIYESARDSMARLTLDSSDDREPVWTPDGRRITFASARSDKATANLYWKRADGIGEVQRLTESENAQSPGAWHPTGRLLAFTENDPKTSTPDIWMLPMDGDEATGWKPGTPTVFLESGFVKLDPAFSPDGRWLAYTSSESGRPEVYVRPFPGPGGMWQVSSGGGRFATWSRNGKELVYLTEEQEIMVATYTIQSNSFRVENPRRWSDESFTSRGGARNFDLHPDGQRFAVLKAMSTDARSHVYLFFNFFDELRRIAPPSRR